MYFNIYLGCDKVHFPVIALADGHIAAPAEQFER